MRKNKECPLCGSPADRTHDGKAACPKFSCKIPAMEPRVWNALPRAQACYRRGYKAGASDTAQCATDYAKARVAGMEKR